MKQTSKQNHLVFNCSKCWGGGPNPLYKSALLWRKRLPRTNILQILSKQQSANFLRLESLHLLAGNLHALLLNAVDTLNQPTNPKTKIPTKKHPETQVSDKDSLGLVVLVCVLEGGNRKREATTEQPVQYFHSFKNPGKFSLEIGKYCRYLFRIC